MHLRKKLSEIISHCGNRVFSLLRMEKYEYRYFFPSYFTGLNNHELYFHYDFNSENWFEEENITWKKKLIYGISIMSRHFFKTFMLMIKGLVDNQKAIGLWFCSNDFLRCSLFWSCLIITLFLKQWIVLIFKISFIYLWGFQAFELPWYCD